MIRVRDSTRGVPHCFLPICVHSVGSELASDCVVEEEAGILEPFECGFGNESAKVQATKERSANHDVI